MINRNQVRLSKLALGLALALAAATPAFAQSTSAGVGGVVTDASGAPVAGADVTITHVASGTVSHATTDASGRYTARGLRVGGPYSIKVDKSGVGSDSEEGVFLDLSQTSTVNATLGGKVTTLATVVAVADQTTSLFSATKMGSGTSVDSATLRALPSINGNIQDFMRLDPRVAFTDRASGSISAGGQNPRFNKITIDGVSASDTFGLEGNNMPTQRQPVSLEAIEALDISLSNYDVTISGAAGANVNAVTKSGGNEFHGSLYGYYRDADWFGDYPARVAGSLSDVTGLPFDEFNNDKTFGFTVGGPILKDRLFFFANYEKLKTTEIGPAGGKSLGTSPLANSGADFSSDDLQQVVDIFGNTWGIDAGGLSGGDTTLEEYALKLDWNINENHRASMRYSKLEQDRLRPEASSASTLSLSSNWYHHVKTVESWVGQVFSDWSDDFSTEFKISYRDYDAVRVNPTTAPTIQVIFDNDKNTAGFQTGGDQIRLGTERSSGNNTLLTKSWNSYGAGTWTLGDHDVKFGFETSDTKIYNFFLQDAWGNYTFAVPYASGHYDFSNLTNGVYADYDLQTNPVNADAVAARYKNRNLGLFLQDTWYVNSNLTLTYGVRGDRPTTSPNPPAYATYALPQGTTPAGKWTGGFGLDNSNTYNGDFIFQPRAGFNYTFDTERQTQLRGGLGLFQGDAPQVWVGNAYSTTGQNYLSYGTSGTQTVGGSGNIVCVRVLTPTPHCANNINFSPDGLNQPIPTGAEIHNVSDIADDFRLPSVWKMNLAIDKELPWYGIVASAEVLLTDVKDGLFYRSLNVGPGFKGPDGRVLYWNPALYANTTARFNNNATFNDVFLIENTNKGKGQQFTISLQKPFSTEHDWSWSLGYTHTNAEEVGALTSSTAGSGFAGQLGFNVNEPSSTTARYEIKDRFSGALNWEHAYFGDYKTRVGLFYEGRSGRPFSYVFNNDANGDARTFNDLFYVPAGNGDVVFVTTASQLNTNTGIVTHVANDAAVEQAFNTWLGTQDRLGQFRGTYAPENEFTAGWVNTFDLRLTQELPGFFEGHKSQLWIDIQNVGNLLNKDWGHVLDYGFNADVAAATLVGRTNTGQYVYTYRGNFNGVPEFGQTNAFGIPTNADSQTNGVSQWGVQVGFKYEF
jgi:hypothetical protein